MLKGTPSTNFMQGGNLAPKFMSALVEGPSMGFTTGFGNEGEMKTLLHRTGKPTWKETGVPCALELTTNSLIKIPIMATVKAHTERL